MPTRADAPSGTRRGRSLRKDDVNLAPKASSSRPQRGEHGQAYILLEVKHSRGSRSHHGQSPHKSSPSRRGRSLSADDDMLPRRSARLSQPPATPPKRRELRQGARRPLTPGSEPDAAVQSTPRVSRTRSASKSREQGRKELKRKRTEEEEDTKSRETYKNLAAAVKKQRGELEKQTLALRTREAALEKRERAAEDLEDTHRILVVSSARQRAEDILKSLENAFTCPLCVDIMACPYTLTPARCGHTFCAFCILKYIKVKFEPKDGVLRAECPVCRTTLHSFPGTTQHSSFAPNRLAEEVLSEQLDALARAIAEFAPAPTPMPASTSRSSRAGRRHGTAERLQAPTDDDRITGWRSGGALRMDWEARDKEGRKRMALELARQPST